MWELHRFRSKKTKLKNGLEWTMFYLAQYILCKVDGVEDFV